MNYAERVKELAQEFAVAAVVTAIVGRLGDSKPSREEADKKAAELLAAIDAMQSALDDAVAKLAERDAEVERLRAEVAAALPAMREYARRNPVHHFGETPQDPNGVHAWLARNDRPSVALSEEVKGGE